MYLYKLMKINLYKKLNFNQKKLIKTEIKQNFTIFYCNLFVYSSYYY